VAEDVRRIVIAAALLVALALLLWAFAVFVWDLLKERTRGWLRVVLVVVLAPSCALAAAVVSAGATLALVTALEPDEAPAGLSEVPARTEPADPETTSTEGTRPETITDRTASPSAAPSPSATAYPSATPSATPYPSASPSATPSPSASPSPESRHERRGGHRARRQPSF
jgi:hypothetical protein